MLKAIDVNEMSICIKNKNLTKAYLVLSLRFNNAKGITAKDFAYSV